MKEVIRLGNIYPSGGQTGFIYSTEGISPTIMSGGNPPTGGGQGSCNAPKIVLPKSLI